MFTRHVLAEKKCIIVGVLVWKHEGRYHFKNLGTGRRKKLKTWL